MYNELDLAEGTSKCNCSICSKGRFWKAIVKAGALRLAEGADALSEYQFASRSIHHFFCRHCGIKTFGKGHLELLGGISTPSTSHALMTSHLKSWPTRPCNSKTASMTLGSPAR